MKLEKGVITKFHRGIVCENRNDFHKSVFNKVYKRAYALANKCVELQLQKEQAGSFGETAENIITFIGRRGTGKSSVMFSFMRGLLHNCDQSQESNNFLVTTKQGKRIQFIGIDWIDASLLEKGEDIFDTILAKMLGELLEDDERKRNLGNQLSYEERELHNKFGNIYKKYLNLKKRNESDFYTSDSAISDLRDLARSNEIREQFRKLVQNYIDVKTSYGDEYGVREADETFLVVAIDDIDMNVEFGFEILEKIQRYLQVDRLLILLAINYDQMKICCEKHFARVYSHYTQNLTIEMQKHVGDVSEQYMEKSLPAYMRIYLPSLKKMDYDRNQLTRVKIRLRNDTEEDCSIKKAVFILAERKTMVKYDVQGMKRHFMEPRTLRELNNHCVFLESMEELDENDADFLEKLDFNYRRSMDDLLFRFASEVMPRREKEIFIELSEMDIRRRGEAIASLFLSEIFKSNWEDLRFVNAEDKQHLHMFERECKVFGSSYGELMRCFYFLGREKLFDKSLVHACLAMYSLVLTRIYYRCKKEELEKGVVANNYRILKELMNGSVAGSWARYLLPDMVTESGTIKTGAIKEAEIADMRFELTESTIKLIDNLNEIKGEQKEDYIEKMAQLAEEIRGEMILLLFLSSKEPFTFSYKLQSAISGSKQQKETGYEELCKAAIYLKNQKADYNVLNFINNIFIFDEIKSNFVRELNRNIVKNKSILNKKEELAEIEEAIIEKMDSSETSFYGKMKKWRKESGGMVVPIYSTDIYYNMLKRIAREKRRNPSRALSQEEHFSCLQNLILEIDEHLKIVDEYYGAGDENGGFSGILCSCPVITEIREEDEKNVVKKLYQQFMEALVAKNSDQLTDLSESDRYANYLD